MIFCWRDRSCTTESFDRLSSARPVLALATVVITTTLCRPSGADAVVSVCFRLDLLAFFRSAARPLLVSFPDGSDAINSSDRYGTKSLGTIGPSKANVLKPGKDQSTGIRSPTSSSSAGLLSVSSSITELVLQLIKLPASSSTEQSVGALSLRGGGTLAGVAVVTIRGAEKACLVPKEV